VGVAVVPQAARIMLVAMMILASKNHLFFMIILLHQVI